MMQMPAPVLRPVPLLLLLMSWCASAALSAPMTHQTNDEATAELFEILDDIIVKGEDVEAVLKKGADPNGTNERGYTVLAIAAASDEPDAVEVLLAAGAEVDKRSKSEITALMLAMGENNPQVVPLLIEAGADINAVDVDGWTPAIWAAHGDSGNAFRALLEKGPKLDTLDKNGWSALTLAVARASRNMIDALVEAGAKWSAPVGGVPILERAVATGDFITVEKVLEHFKELEVRGPEQETPLMMAAKGGHKELVVDLLRLGADRTAKDGAGKTALDHAKEQGDATVIGLLGGDWTAQTPHEETVVELPCEPLGGTLRAGLEVEGQTLRAALYYPRLIHSYLDQYNERYSPPGDVEADVALNIDTDSDKNTGIGKKSAKHEVEIGTEWSAVFTEVWDGVRYNNQHTPATRALQVWMYKEGEEMNSWDMNDWSPETTMELDRASFELPFEVVGLEAGKPIRIGIAPVACPSSAKVIELRATTPDSVATSDSDATPADKEKQRRTVEDIRMVGTAFMAWLIDNVGETTVSWEAGADLSAQELAELLSEYISQVPETDGWGNRLVYRPIADELEARELFWIISPGRDGELEELPSTASSFPEGEVDRDIVWKDGFLMRWPESSGH